MKFLADENIDKSIVEHLRRQGHIILYVSEMKSSISDDEIIKQANQENAILLTADKDFGELVFRQNRVVYGVILIRLVGLSSAHKAELVASALQKYSNELTEHFAVITPGAIRIRKQPPREII
jgi:predicted nuclease of predicted toxin-antitoxin system